MNISFAQFQATINRHANKIRNGAVNHYRHHYRFWFNFSALLAIVVIPSLTLVIISNNDATALLAVEDHSTRQTPRAELNSNQFTDNQTSNIATLSTSPTPWDEAEATRSIASLEDDAQQRLTIETREIELGKDTPILYFDGKPVRPVRTMTMEVTGYSPDARSCAPFDDGITASGKSVWTNGMKLIAADKRFKFGSLMSVPGYNGNKPTPVLDRGGAIKGNKLDLLFPTHEIARQWGRQKVTVTLWDYLETDEVTAATTSASTATSG